MRKVYLAGPEVFLPDAVEVGRRKVAICARHGLEGIFPLDLDEPSAPNEAAAIFAACLRAMRGCDAAIANLTPFRSVSADPGTAFELGFLMAAGRPMFGYSNETVALAERVSRRYGPLASRGEQLFAADGAAVESFDHFDNLMLAEALRVDGPGVFLPRAPVGDPARDLATFETCVSFAATALSRTPR